ncbi:MAG TPA: hypothetical protein VMX95_02795 [Thermodesulfobacteriota bacterium]|nr:hypothetical protein [Thermodesulfobacteriota bacterium]
MTKLSDDFLSYFYYGIREDYLERIKGEKLPLSEVFMGLTRNNPAVVSCDKNGKPNGSIKSVGFILKEPFLEEAISDYDNYLSWRFEEIKKKMGRDYEGSGWLYSPHPDFIVPGLKQSLKYLYLPKEEAEQKIDFEKLCTLEGFFKKTWENVQENKKVAIVYYYPPGTHFQVNCTVEIKKSGPIREFINRSACVAHGENPAKWAKRPAYIFHVEEVIDKSIYPDYTRDK